MVPSRSAVSGSLDEDAVDRAGSNPEAVPQGLGPVVGAPGQMIKKLIGSASKRSDALPCAARAFPVPPEGLPALSRRRRAQRFDGSLQLGARLKSVHQGLRPFRSPLLVFDGKL